MEILSNKINISSNMLANIIELAVCSLFLFFYCALDSGINIVTIVLVICGYAGLVSLGITLILTKTRPAVYCTDDLIAFDHRVIARRGKKIPLNSDFFWFPYFIFAFDNIKWSKSIALSANEKTNKYNKGFTLYTDFGEFVVFGLKTRQKVIDKILDKSKHN